MRKCTCIRCKAKDYVLSIYPDMDDHRVLLVAEKIVRALRSSIAESRLDPVAAPTASSSALSEDGE